MRIEKIYLKQVGPFEELLLELPPGSDPKRADVYLLTGPNGSGKSTILYALAGVLASGNKQLGQDLGEKRIRSKDSFSALCAEGQWLAECLYQHGTPLHRLNVHFPMETSANLVWIDGAGPTAFYAASNAQGVCLYGKLAARFQPGLPKDAITPFSWAAFAYAGMRSVQDVRVNAIQEPTDSPFEQSLSFLSTTNTQRLAHWIANQDFKRLKAKEAGKLDRANAISQSIEHIEHAISRITGEDFRFITSDEDNNVRIRFQGRVVDMGLLPDGLQSIVSWIADLLMRLDRIPWVEDIPVLERSFLLILDEVDIHLHPAWQRKVLPIVQEMFPNAQIIASTHSPFVVASVMDGAIIPLKVQDGLSTLDTLQPAQAGISYSAVLRSIFGITSEFDVETERDFQAFHEAKQKLLSGSTSDRSPVDEIAAKLAQRSEELRELIALELRQLERQIARKVQ